MHIIQIQPTQRDVFNFRYALTYLRHHEPDLVIRVADDGSLDVSLDELRAPFECHEYLLVLAAAALGRLRLPAKARRIWRSQGYC